MLKLSTVGNATLIAYDKEPILTTDPWISDEDYAYFGSWIGTHKNLVGFKKEFFKLSEEINARREGWRRKGRRRRRVW